MGGGRALWWADDGTCVVRTSLWVHGRTQARGVRAGWVGQSENFEEGEAERNMPEQKAKLVVGALVVWFGSQIVASVVNRALLGNKKKSVYPLTFSFCQFSELAMDRFYNISGVNNLSYLSWIFEKH